MILQGSVPRANWRQLPTSHSCKLSRPAQHEYFNPEHALFCRHKSNLLQSNQNQESTHQLWPLIPLINITSDLACSNTSSQERSKINSLFLNWRQCESIQYMSMKIKWYRAKPTYRVHAGTPRHSPNNYDTLLWYHETLNNWPHHPQSTQYPWNGRSSHFQIAAESWQNHVLPMKQVNQYANNNAYNIARHALSRQEGVRHVWYWLDRSSYAYDS